MNILGITIAIVIISAYILWIHRVRDIMYHRFAVIDWVFEPSKLEYLDVDAIRSEIDRRLKLYNSLGHTKQLLMLFKDPIKMWPKEIIDATADLRTPDEWQEFLKVKILDPDGWRQEDCDHFLPKKNFDVPISVNEFKLRYAQCTVMNDLATS